MNNIRVIKSLHMPKFSVELVQDEDGRYSVRYKTQNDPEQNTSWSDDYSIANYMFDIKIRDLEGN